MIIESTYKKNPSFFLASFANLRTGHENNGHGGFERTHWDQNGFLKVYVLQLTSYRVSVTNSDIKLLFPLAGKCAISIFNGRYFARAHYLSLPYDFQ